MLYKMSVLENSNRNNELIELFETGLEKTDNNFWNWRFFTDDGQTDQPLALVVDDENGKMVGMTSGIPISYLSGKYKGLILCDWVVHPEHRGKGLIKMMFNHYLEFYQSKGYDFLFAYNPNENSSPILKKYGFIFSSDSILWISKNRLITRSKNFCNREIGNCRYTFSDSVPTCISGKSERLDRSNRYLKWRFDLNPSCDFKWMIIENNTEIIGYFVFSINKGRLRTAVNIYDWELFNFDESVFLNAIKLLSKYGTYVTIWGVFPENIQKSFRNTGFKPSEKSANFVYKPISEKGYPLGMTLTRADTDC